MAEARALPQTGAAHAAALAALRAELPRAMLADRPRLERALRALERGDAGPAGRLARLRLALARSVERAARRARSVPAVAIPQALPIHAHREALADVIARHQVVIVCGDTGSGKSTQLPKLCLEAGRGITGLIGHTQPRRIAAYSVAGRIADELGCRLGGAVGYQVRFEQQLGADTLIKVMTDGVLLAEMAGDRALRRYDTLIIDEAHERSLNIDMLLGHLRRLLPQRPELRVIVASATIEAERFSAWFDGAPVVMVAGRQYPVTVRYRPPAPGQTLDDDDTRNALLADAVTELLAEGPGDVLVFLASEHEIHSAEAALGRRLPAGIEVLPLYGRLAARVQRRVFAPHRARRVVLATNIAETSLTVPGIRHVVDSGRARISRFNPRTKVQRLPIEPVARASAAQRAGRCGRLGPGVCIRLYDEADHDARPAHAQPEVQRTGLASVVLKLAALGVRDLAAFPFLDAPDARQLRAASQLLRELGAFDREERLTPTGRELARLPLDPRIGRQLVEARARGVLVPVRVIAAGLSVPELRERPGAGAEAGSAAQRHFAHPDSDFLWYWNVWRFLEREGGWRSARRLRALARRFHLSMTRLAEWRDVVAELEALTAGWPGDARRGAPYASVHKALLAGLVGQVGRRGEEGVYQGPRSQRFVLHPGSVLATARPLWVVAAELVETRRVYARTVAKVRPTWIAEVAGESVRRELYDPRWDAGQGRVVAREQRSLHGLVLSDGRRVDLARDDPVAAREIFIRSALVDDGLRGEPALVASWRAAKCEVRSLEARLRRADVLADEERLYEVFDRRLPARVCCERTLERWCRRALREAPERLVVAPEELMRAGRPAVDAALYPTRLEVAGRALALEYCFAPGTQADGVTVTVPLATLPALAPAAFEWMVPAYRSEQLAALLRTLPKALRRRLPPVADLARRAAAELGPASGALPVALSDFLWRHAQVEVPASHWALDALPAHLRFRFRVVDDAGQVVAEGRDLARIRERLVLRGRAALHDSLSWEQAGRLVRGWSFGALPARLERHQDGQAVLAFPTLVDRDDAVELAVHEDAAVALMTLRRGVRRLLVLALARDLRRALRALPGLDGLELAAAAYGGAAALRGDLTAAAVEEAALAGSGPVRTPEAFERCVDRARAGVGPALAALTAAAGEALEAWREAHLRVDALPAGALRTELEQQLAGMVHPGFLLATPLQWLERMPRYLAAVGRRIDKAAGAPGRDRALAAEFAACWQELAPWLAGRWRHAPEVQRIRWQFEEWRVSLFAQHLGVRERVSAPRLRRAIAGLDDQHLDAWSAGRGPAAEPA